MEILMSEVDTGFTRYLKDTFEIMNKLGLLLVSGDMNNHNVMTIGWAAAGIIWRKPIFVILVRPSRYTYGLIEKNGEFTVNVPSSQMDRIVSFCGSVSGRDHDKFREKNLTPLPGKKVNCPLIKECSISYECRVVHKNDVIPTNLFPNIPPEYYPQGDYHRVYFGEILTAYKIV
ncbi:flavin reductase family protein [Candidatus Aerophobetes bacterium]|uniref:Flavin reductase family protein n=1 Tax=Aerophobetes bacterium TaxID=2030807 RepID=A0A662DB71_UNCAE|nr:MAG: flavin reductase family protein [Candidatus Aerophobetes bacterium]